MLATVSIITPVYNAGEFLPKCMNSLVSQTYHTIEILCINDGSKDKSLQVLQEFAEKDCRIKVFDQVNSGPARARNVGLENATGDYVMFCDADDWYEPTMVEEMLYVITHYKTDFVMCDTSIVEEVSGFERGDNLEYYKLPFVGLQTLKKASEKLKINATLWNKIFQADTIKKYNISFPEGCLHEDDAFIMQYVTVSNSVYALDKKLYNYLIRAKDSIMAKYFCCQKTTKMDRIAIVHFFYSWLVRNNLYHTNKKLFSIVYSRNVMGNFYRLEESSLVSAIKNEKAFLLNMAIANTKHIKRIKRDTVEEIIDYLQQHKKKSKWKILKYKILSKIAFGKIRERYKDKCLAHSKECACPIDSKLV